MASPPKRRNGPVAGTTRYGRRTIGLREMMRRATGIVPEHWRPKTRGDCVNGPRPCPFVGCRYHLWMEVTDHHGLRFSGGAELEHLWRMDYSCALDAADQGPCELEDILRWMRMTRGRYNQLEQLAAWKLKASAAGLLP